MNEYGAETSSKDLRWNILDYIRKGVGQVFGAKLTRTVGLKLAIGLGRYMYYEANSPIEELG